MNKRIPAVGCLCALTLAGMLFGYPNFRQPAALVQHLDSKTLVHVRAPEVLEKLYPENMGSEERAQLMAEYLEMSDREKDELLDSLEYLRGETQSYLEIKDEKPVLDLYDDGTGVYSENVFVGKNAAAVHVNFHYSKSPEDDAVPLITSIDSVNMTIRCGWFSLGKVSVDWKNVSLTDGQTCAVVPFQYQASVGVGGVLYDACVAFDLR